MGIELGTVCMPSGHVSDRTTAPGKFVLMDIRFADSELLLILCVTVRHFKQFSQSNVNGLYIDTQI